MKRLFQNLYDRFSGGSLSDEFSAPAHNDDDHQSLEETIAQNTKAYTDVMLERIARFSEEQQSQIDVPDALYHASLHKNLPSLDPEVGQGLGVWFQRDLASAAHFCVSRSCNPMTDEPYPDADPSIYEAQLNVKNFAVFPDEISLYNLRIQDPDDGDDLKFSPEHFSNLHNVRKSLVEAGYDGIYLMREGTFSAIDSAAIEVVEEHDPFPIFNAEIRPNLPQQTGGDRYAWIPEI